jgi:hypothetical protein
MNVGLTAKAKGTGDFTPIEAGVHLAVCYGIYDLGTHRDEKYEKDRHQIVVLWEVPDSRIEIERDGRKRDLPRAISNRYTLSLNEKATLRKDLEAWRGRPFTAEELDGFDMRNILGKSCQLGIVHVTKGDRTFATINSILGLPRGVKPLDLENEMQWFSFEESVDIPTTAPDWIKEQIAASKEFVAACNKSHEVPPPAAVRSGDDEGPHYTASDDPGTSFTDDEIPF